MKSIVEVTEKYKITKNNKIMIYFKMISMKFNKYIKDKKKKIYKKSKVSILKILLTKNVIKYWKYTKKNLFPEQPNEFFSK